MPQDRARFRLFPAQNPAYCENPPTAPPRICASFSLRSKNSSVAEKSFDVSVVMNISELAYTAAREARLVYHEKSTAVSPARYQISSDSALSSAREAGMFSSKDMWPRA